MRCARAVVLLASVAVLPGMYVAEAPAVTAASTSSVTVDAPAPISPPDGGGAGVTSSVTVSGLSGTVSDVDVRFNMSGNFPADLDVALRSPSGQIVMLMSDDCGGGFTVTPNLLFDDEASFSINAATLVECQGTVRFKPTLDTEVDGVGFPVPTSTALSAFDGVSANGTWTLFVADDVVGNLNSLPTGFSLWFTLADNTIPGNTVPPISRLPDGLIKKGALAFVGDGIYNTTGAGQSMIAKTKRTKKAAFLVDVQNDGNANDTFALLGAGKKKGFRVTYFAGTTDITTGVVAGTYRINNLSPGQQQVIKLVVKVKATAKKGILRSWPITTTSTKDTTRTDTVLANVKVPKG